MSEIKNIAYVASECQPFFTSGGLAEVIGSLPKKIVKQSKGDIQITVYLPLYDHINTKYANKLVYVGHHYVNLSWRSQYCGIYKYIEDGVKYYFIDNEYYFKRDRLYGYFDDAERFAFFSKAVIDTMLFLEETPELIHCHDWQTGMLSVYLRTLYYGHESFRNTKTIFTIHNIEYQGKYSFDSDIIRDVFGISNNDAYLLEYNHGINIMKAAMECSNIVSTVSRSYAEEIMTPEFAHGLEAEVQRINEEGKLRGILNGIDKVFYNPAKDKALFTKFDAKTIELKTNNKLELQKMLGLAVDPKKPLYAMITRLVEHKGLNILKGALPEVLSRDLQLVILGTGDSYYEGYLKDLEAKYPHKLRVILAFNQDLARKIYGASDFFLMPSTSEPCGLSQMIASRYGSIPLVRRCGGLKDSICDFSVKGGNGFTFDGDRKSVV